MSAPKVETQNKSEPVPISNIPIPDPSLLTTDQLRRELAGLRDTIETRLDAMDRAKALLQENIRLIPADTDRQIGHLKELHAEKFAGVIAQHDQTKIDGKVALDAALLAAEKAVAQQNACNAAAVAKTESAFTKQIEQLADTMRALNKSFDERLWSLTKAVDDKIGDIKDRVTSIESRTVGGHESTAARTASSDNMTKVLGIALAAFMALMAGITWLGANHSSPNATPSAVAVVPVQPSPAARTQ